MDEEKRFNVIVMKMFSTEDHYIDDRTVKNTFKKNQQVIGFLRKFDLDFLEFFLKNIIDKPENIKYEMLSEAVLYQSTFPDYEFYDYIKSSRTYGKQIKKNRR